MLSDYNENFKTIEDYREYKINKILEMGNIKTFNEFKVNENINNDRLSRILKSIVRLTAEECSGSSVHPSEEFGDGGFLKELANNVDDITIAKILNKMADCCEAECDGSAEHMNDWIYDNDCKYICNFLGMPELDLSAIFNGKDIDLKEWY